MRSKLSLFIIDAMVFYLRLLLNG